MLIQLSYKCHYRLMNASCQHWPWLCGIWKYLESSAKYSNIRECLRGQNVLIKTKLDFLFLKALGQERKIFTFLPQKCFSLLSILLHAFGFYPSSFNLETILSNKNKILKGIFPVNTLVNSVLLKIFPVCRFRDFLDGEEGKSYKGIDSPMKYECCSTKATEW